MYFINALIHSNEQVKILNCRLYDSLCCCNTVLLFHLLSGSRQTTASSFFESFTYIPQRPSPTTHQHVIL